MAPFRRGLMSPQSGQTMLNQSSGHSVTSSASAGKAPCLCSCLFAAIPLAEVWFWNQTEYPVAPATGLKVNVGVVMMPLPVGLIAVVAGGILATVKFTLLLQGPIPTLLMAATTQL